MSTFLRNQWHLGLLPGLARIHHFRHPCIQPRHFFPVDAALPNRSLPALALVAFMAPVVFFTRKKKVLLRRPGNVSPSVKIGQLSYFSVISEETRTWPSVDGLSAKGATRRLGAFLIIRLQLVSSAVRKEERNAGKKRVSRENDSIAWSLCRMATVPHAPGGYRHSGKRGHPFIL